jgi:pyrimidine-nucleoside phosphorylase
VAENLQEGRERIGRAIGEGRAWDLFLESVRLQGGDVEAVEDPKKLPTASQAETIRAEREGFVCAVDAESLGTSSVLLGAGRFRKEDDVDPAAGITLHAKIGEWVSKGQDLATLHFNDERRLEDARRLAESGFSLSSEPPPPYRLVQDTVLPES